MSLIIQKSSPCLCDVSPCCDLLQHIDFSRRQLLLSPDADHFGVGFSDELQQLQKLLQFPEEVAFQLTETELRIFTSVRPVEYIRQVTLDLSRIPNSSDAPQQLSVQDLIHHFQQVSFIASSILGFSLNLRQFT